MGTAKLQQDTLAAVKGRRVEDFSDRGLVGKKGI